VRDGRYRSKTTVALLGGLARHDVAPAFQRSADQRHWRLETLAKGACRPMSLPNTSFLGRLVEYFLRCEQWRGQIMDRYAPSTRGWSW